ncbi:hypothetical protein HPB52_001218 [Rhipicephalus sanguineus]|uniref:CCHC-type domain-containing protein n=1 Tax=Rhipicephalus sanguineus TaxID=34632 RepID=A0A9D4SZD5_RHISA|nr:hypothetical protein HPB52_001218 [Rhipicephalus sanguineus]
MIGEQFLEGCSMRLRVFLKERNCKTLDALAKSADCFIEAQHLTNMSKEKTLKEATVEHSGKAEIPKTSRSTDRCFLCDKAGHRASECWSRSKGTPADRGWSRRSGPGGGPSRQETGQASCMLAPSPPENPTDDRDGYVVLQSGETIPIVNTTLMPPAPGCDVAKLPVRRGFLESQPVSVLRDTGCNTVVVRHSLIPREKMTGTTTPVFLLDRTIHYLPEAMVFLDTPFFTGLARVKCMRDPLYDVVLGNVEGGRPPNDPVSLWSPDRTRSDTSPPSMRGPPTSQLGRPDIKDKGTNEVGNVASSQTQKLAPELPGRDPRSRPSVRPLKTCASACVPRASTGSGAWATTVLGDVPDQPAPGLRPTHAWTVGDSIAARSTCREGVSVPSPRR